MVVSLKERVEGLLVFVGVGASAGDEALMEGEGELRIVEATEGEGIEVCSCSSLGEEEVVVEVGESGKDVFDP